MRILLSLAWLTLTAAFRPHVMPKTTTTKLEMAAVDRRQVLVTGAAFVLTPVVAHATPQAVSSRKGVSTNGSTWFFDENIENVREEAQMPTGDKLDLNSASVTEYKQFRGMYPHAAGMIAANGPYNAVKDIYKIKGIDDNDKKLFKQYEKEFMVNPPGRMFDERINQRQST